MMHDFTSALLARTDSKGIQDRGRLFSLEVSKTRSGHVLTYSMLDIGNLW